MVLFLLLFFGSCEVVTKQQQPPVENVTAFNLDELQHRTFNYFWELADINNFQIPDRYPKRTFTSIAATGFGLTAYIVGVEKGYVTRAEAAERVLNTLKVLYNLPQGDEMSGTGGYKGFFYHFLTYENATRFKDVELSSIDTGLLMAGVLSVQSYFDGENETENSIRQLADDLYRRVEWDWMMADEGTMSMGWRPEKGKIIHTYKGYSEAMILYILALGSPTHAIEPGVWQNWTKTYPWETYQDQDFVNYSPLFTHHYSHMYIDFRGIQDEYMRGKGIDYFENSRRATIANRNYCLENPENAVGYSENCWGLTACDGPGYKEMEIDGKNWTFHGYSARGASSVYTRDDGTIAPTAAGGSVPFAPEICLPALQYMWETYNKDLVGEYGFKDAFNLTWEDAQTGEKGWFDDDYLGIDQGPILIQIENYKTGLVWEVMSKNPYIIQGLKKAGFSGGWLENIE
ncbi:MAG: Tat pathway signal protein [Bacteroidetes bacterium]|nr:MAG: Tat pathway signal protein [Bacteroidota bacterium]